MEHELFEDEMLATAPPELSIILDCTFSMTREMESLPKFLVQYVLHRAMADNPITAVSVVGFDDHYVNAAYTSRGGWEAPLRSLAPSTNLEEVAFFIKTLRIGHGADDQEAIACALDRSRRLHPDAQRWLITDDVPHGVPVNRPREDDFPKGCPCGVQLVTNDVNILLPDRYVPLEVPVFWRRSAKNVLRYPNYKDYE